LLPDLQKVNSLIRKKEYKKGELLFVKGNTADYLYIVRHGKIKLYDDNQDFKHARKPVGCNRPISGQYVFKKQVQKFISPCRATRLREYWEQPEKR
jgi:CRP-like cAMP-binding protein